MTFAATNPPAEALARLVDRHGARAILATFIAVIARRARARRRARLDAATISDRLRHDLGLPSHTQAPRRYWEIH